MELVLHVIGLISVLAMPFIALSIAARRTRSMWVAAIAICVAMPLQLMGFTGTCTQGADGPFITGVFLSAPFLLGAIYSVLQARPKGASFWIGGIATAVGSLAMIILTHSAWLGSMLYGTPCGADYSPNERSVLIILLGYLALPLLVCAFAIRAVREARRPTDVSK